MNPNYLTRTYVFKYVLLSLFLCYFTFDVKAENTDGQYKKREVKIGERLFHGLIGNKKDAINCAGCHNSHPIDTFNWYPSVYEIAKTTQLLSDKDFESLLSTSFSIKAETVHKGIDLSEEEVQKVRTYLHYVYENGPKTSKRVINDLILFLATGIIILLLLLDLIIFKKIKYRFIHFIIILIAAIVHLDIAVEDAIAMGRSENYEPDQPIKFSHKIHAGDNQTDCQYCHHFAEDSKSAGIPSNNVCLNCHNVVKEGSMSGQFEINKVHAAQENKEPVEWIKVHNLPDHAFFSHAQHIKAAGLDCKECHGNIEEMDRVSQVEDLSMGWCVNCHRTTKVNFTGNEFYNKYKKLIEESRQKGEHIVTVDEVGGIDCMKCHY